MHSSKSKRGNVAAAPAMRALTPSMLAAAVACVCGNAWAVQGGTIVGGQGAIATQGATTNVSQASDKMVVNWKSFDIGQSETVNFAQPTASSAVLNRVVGATKATEILGALNANGRVFVVNQAGVMFGKTASVNTDSLVASTMDIDTQQFMDGGRASGSERLLDLKAGSGSALVSNEGKLNAKTQVALLGGQVVNTGNIRANGNVTLGAARSATLGIKNSTFSVTLNAPELNAMVRNDGLVVSQGGDVRLSAMGTGDALRKVVTNTGTLEAHTAKLGTGGAIVLGSDADGQVSVSGTLAGDKSISIETAPRVQGAKGGAVAIEQGARLQASDIAINAAGNTTTSAGAYIADRLTLSGDNVIVNSAIDAGNVNLNARLNVQQNANVSAAAKGVVNVSGGSVTQADGVITRGQAIAIAGAADNGAVKTATLQGSDIRVSGKNVTLAGDVLADQRLEVSAAQGGNITAAKQLKASNGSVMVNATTGNVVTNGAVSGNDVQLTGAKVTVNADVNAMRDIVVSGGAGGVNQNANLTSTAGNVNVYGSGIDQANGVTKTAATGVNLQAMPAANGTAPGAIHAQAINAAYVNIGTTGGAVSLNGDINADGGINVNAMNGALVAQKSMKAAHGAINLNADSIAANGAIDANQVQLQANGIDLNAPITANADVTIDARMGQVTQTRDVVSKSGNVAITGGTIDQAAGVKTTAANQVRLMANATSNGQTYSGGVANIANASGRDVSVGGRSVNLNGALTADSTVQADASMPGGVITQRGALTSDYGSINLRAETIQQLASSNTKAGYSVALQGSKIASGEIAAGNMINLSGQEVTLGGKLSAPQVSVPANAKNTAGNIVITQSGGQSQQPVPPSPEQISGDPSQHAPWQPAPEQTSGDPSQHAPWQPAPYQMSVNPATQSQSQSIAMNPAVQR